MWSSLRCEILRWRQDKDDLASPLPFGLPGGFGLFLVSLAFLFELEAESRVGARDVLMFKAHLSFVGACWLMWSEIESEESVGTREKGECVVILGGHEF